MLREDPSSCDSNSKRVQYFESIWQKAKGTDFEKTLAMLRAYCQTSNWGTYQHSVWPIIEKYFGSKGYLKTIQNKNVLLFSIEFLLFQLSEHIVFRLIKEEGSLAALFQVLRHHTSINPYDFGDMKGLYEGYAPFAKKIKVRAATTDSWKGVLEYCAPENPEHYNSKPVTDFYKAVSEFFKAKFIDYVDGWQLMEMIPDLKSCQFYEICPVADKDMESLLFSDDKIQNNNYLLQYAYSQKYKLGNVGIRMICDIERQPHGERHLALLQTFVRMTKCALAEGRVVDGAFLLDRVKKMYAQHLKVDLSDNIPYMERDYETILELILIRNLKDDLFDNISYMERYYEIILELIQIRKSLKCWSEIEAILFLQQDPDTQPELNGASTIGDIKEYLNAGMKKINFIKLLNTAISKKWVDVVDYLLNENKIAIDLKTRCNFSACMPVQSTLIQITISRIAVLNFYLNDSVDNMDSYLQIIRMLLKHDPDCIIIQDDLGHDIFSFLDYLRKTIGDCKQSQKELIQGKVDALYQEITQIYRAYYGKRAFSFYQGRKDVCEQPGELPDDVLKMIAANTMCEITVRKGS